VSSFLLYYQIFSKNDSTISGYENVCLECAAMESQGMIDLTAYSIFSGIIAINLSLFCTARQSMTKHTNMKCGNKLPSQLVFPRV
jgi:hypothetical protein